MCKCYPYNEFPYELNGNTLTILPNIDPLLLNDSAPIHCAVQFNKIQILENLLILGYNPDILNHNGFSSLHCAVKDNKQSFINILLTNGANPRIIDKNKYTPVMYVAKHKRHNLFEIFINHVNTPDELNTTDFTLLHYATQHHLYYIVDLLLNRGANYEILDKYGESPLNKAIIHRDVRSTKIIINYILQWGNAIYLKYELYNSLEYAFKNADNEILKLILSNLDINLYNDLEISNIWINVIRYANLDLLKILIYNKQLNPNLLNHNGFSPLHCAVSARKKNIDIIELLLKNNVNPNSKNNRGDLPLFMAIEYNQPDIVRLLIQNGADLFIKAYGVLPSQFAEKCRQSNPYIRDLIYIYGDFLLICIGIKRTYNITTNVLLDIGMHFTDSETDVIYVINQTNKIVEKNLLTKKFIEQKNLSIINT